METRRKCHDVELASLRHQLLDAQIISDEKTVLGKLRHQLTTLEMSEVETQQNLMSANTKVEYCVCVCVSVW